PLAVAGLWAAWRDPDAPPDAVEAGTNWLHSATIVTTAANDVMAPVHDRMPVTVPPERWAEWLDPTNDDLEALGTLFTPGETPWVMHSVSTEVNKVSNNDASLIDPI
ncbi:MAG: SOS response-associated peptidase family protein, partial [Actinomycetota bacterium]